MTANDIKQLIEQSRGNEAIAAADQLLNTQLTSQQRATIFFLRGNAYRQLGDMRMAMNSYLEAQALDPDGPAAMALDTCLQILDFYNKDLYNP